MAETSQSQPSIIQLNSDSEGTTNYTDEYIFQQIGSSLPLNPNSSTFDLSDPPSQALAISQNPNSPLIFIAHSSGFYVVRTKDAIEAAKLSKEKKERCCCIQELSVVDVRIGKVRILAVSKDSSTLAAVVGFDVYFYSTEALLNKEQEPSYLCSIDDASHVKDFKWRKKLKTSFIVLSSDGKLYHGKLKSPLKEVMENVDAVDWSAEGNFIAVAKENSIIICSSRFKEKFTLSMPFDSCSLEVDSINWIRQDCIALGCSQRKEDGYVIQLISSKEGNISEGSSKPVVLSFNEAFPCIDDEIVPSGHGPHLFLNYLEHREIALLANKKSTDDHIVLFNCSFDADQKEPALIAFSQDNYLPRIPIQENEDDNLIMGFGVDTTSLYEKVQVTLGIEQKELSPYCILLCLTLDEKLLMFYVAGQTESPDSRKIESEISDEDEDSTVVISSHTSSLLKEDKLEETDSHTQSPDTSSEEVETEEDGHIDELQINDLNDDLRTSARAGDVSNRDSTSCFSMPIQSAGQHQDKLQPQIGSTLLNTNANLISSTERQQNANPPSSNLLNISESPSKSFGSESFSKDSRKPEAQKSAFPSSGSLGFSAFSGSTPSVSESPFKSFGTESFSKDSRKPEAQKSAFPSSGSLGFSAFSGSTPSVSESPSKSFGSELFSKDSRKPEAQKSAFSSSGSMGFSAFSGSTPSVSESPSKSFGTELFSKDSRKPEAQKSAFPSSGSLGFGAFSGSTPSISESPSKSFGSELFSKDSRKPEAQKSAFSSSGSMVSSAVSGTTPSVLHSTSKGGNDGTSNVPPSNSQKEGFLNSSSGAHSSYKTLPTESSTSRPSSSIVNKVEQPSYRSQNPVNVTGANTSSVLPRSNILTSKDSNASSTFPSNASNHIGGLKSSTQNPVEPKLQPTVDKVRTAQSSYGMGSEREFSKHFGNVNEMSKELDNLLLQIEEEGGYRDTCIIFQRNSVLGIEQGLEDLSKRCRAWKGVMEDRLEGIQNLLDQTVQVLSKKIYIEGIVKQASDTQYWDLWNRQKLTPELELKRRQILKVNQTLTSQLIELERHFNTLELNKFGDSNEVLSARRGFHSGSKPSRDGQAFHRLYNTMSSQLAVAEQLSESLSKQMEVLNIESPSARRKSVTKELFESIGLSYEGDSFKSPNTKKSLRSPDSVKRFQLSSVSAATKEQSRRNSSSVVKTFEPETARRRVSLDRSWASFEPPKTTVKRMLLQEERPTVTATKSSLVTNKEGLKLSSPASYPKNRSHSEVDKVIQDRAPTKSPTTSSINLTGDFSGKSQSSSMKSHEVQLQQRNTQRDKLLSPPETQNKPNQSFGFSFSKSDNSITQAKPFSNAKSNLQSESKVNQTSTNLNFTPPQVPVLSKETPKLSVKFPPNLNTGGTSEVKAPGSAFSLSSSPVFDFHKRSSQSESVSNETQLGPQKKSSQSETVSKETQSGASTISPPTFTVTPPTKPSISEPVIPSSIPPSSSSSLSTFKSDAIVKSSTNDKLSTAPSFSSSSFSTPSFGSTASFPTPSISSATGFKPITPPVEPKPTVTDLNLKPDVSSSQAPPSQSPPSQAPPSQPEPVPAAPATSGFSFNNVMINAKSETPAVATQEDEMEEEAPDMNLGGFGGFGLGSTPTTTSEAPKPNPFGGFLNTSPNPSPFNLSVPSGELFKPASFNIGQTFQHSQPATQSAFGSTFTPPEPTRSAFGQPAQIGVGQQALGSVLGSFGQSRQLGLSPPGAGFASTPGFGGGGGSGFGTPPSGGFAGAAASVGGFAKAASAGGGFAGVASSGGGGFAGVGSAGGGGGFGAFGNQQQGGGGLGGAASGGGGFGAFGNQQSGGGGFGGFGNQQGGGGFSAFGSAAGNPLLTQMRK
ncbi:hypothetical protein ACHQM5_018674 [Ranunculus cassubicifolius]